MEPMKCKVRTEACKRRSKERMDLQGQSQKALPEFWGTEDSKPPKSWPACCGHSSKNTSFSFGSRTNTLPNVLLA